MSDVYKVLRSFERWDEKDKATRKYPRGAIIPPKEAAKILSLPTLLAAGNIYRLPEELAKEVVAIPEAV